MRGKYINILSNNKFYKQRKEKTLLLVKSLKKAMNEELNGFKVTIFVVGSIGRDEVGDNSDLDIFILSKDEISQIEQYQIYSKLIKINKNLDFPEFSNDGEFLTIHKLKDLKNLTGSPKDDLSNLFTARMLMLLESKVLFNQKLYTEILKDIVSLYSRDKPDKPDTEFNPTFLINDILRYWRTLCLNYEVIRHDADRPWKKKNTNLKYSRMLTVFSTILTIIIKKDIKYNNLYDIFAKTPLERMAWSLDKLEDIGLDTSFDKLLDYYKIFLDAKEKTDINDDIEIKKILNINAEHFSDIIFSLLNHNKIDNKLKKFLMI